MKHISILVPKGAVLACIDDPRHLFDSMNDFLIAARKPPMFKVQLVGVEKNVELHKGSFTVHADLLLHEVEKTDLIFIPALSGDMKTSVEMNRDFIPWIVKQYQAGAEVASLCIGAFLLAATGLLDGKKCSTHWMFANEFRNMYPMVNLVDDKIVTDESGIYSSGGANSYWNLLLYLIEKYANRQMAVLASKYFLIEIDRNSQSPFTMFKGQKEHEDEPVRKAQEFIETNFQDRISVDQLADMSAIGRRSFERRFKKATNNTVVEYIQRVKVEAAKKDFELSRKNINEVMYEVGYSDTKAFRTIFRKVTGLSPVAYRNRYNKELITA